MKSISRRRFGAFLALFAALVALTVLGIIQVVTNDSIAPGVKVAGVDVGGRSVSEAADTLRRELWPVIGTVRLHRTGKEPVTLALADLGITLDAPATAAAARQLGGVSMLGLDLSLGGDGGEVEPVIAVDAAKLDAALVTLGEEADEPARNARLTVRKGWGIVVVPSSDGQTVDATALVASVTEAAAAGKAYSGPVPMRVVTPEVSTDIARSRAVEATTYFSRPILLRHASRTIVLEPAAMADMLSVNLRSDAARYPLTFRNDRARRALHRLFEWAERPAVDADIVVREKGGITITEAQDGEALDMGFLLEDMDAAAISKGQRTVVVSTSPVLPRLTAEEVRAQGLASLGSQFTTYFDAGNEARARNIALAAKLVDGAIVEPGQIFSLNEAMGPRTVNRGFDYAPVIAGDGVLRQGVGGGICQYATTLFNTALLAGLPIVDRQAHGLYIAHYPVGRDATVAWGSIDFTFRNDTGRKLVIRSWTHNNALTVALVGRTGRSVALATGRFYDVRSPVHTKSNPRVVFDADLGPGVVRWEQGVDGRSIKVERVVRDADGRVLFRDSFVSRYVPLDWVKRVGTS